ncbi:hypothetical protein MBLNU457_4655t1 [Dothideomycetes sp. NU457]
MSIQSWFSTIPARSSHSETILGLRDGVTSRIFLLCLSYEPMIEAIPLMIERARAYGLLKSDYSWRGFNAKVFAYIVGFGITSGLYNYLHKCFSPSSLPIIPSPLVTNLPGKSVWEHSEPPYPPDALPGARDVDTPHGKVRAYEWGPEDGRKVLLVHGISTPCISLARLAENLVQKGCRIILFDLYGRGYSATPNPEFHPQNAELFTHQMLAVLASSPLAWTGDNAFDLIGYSLGGGISVAFTSCFPRIVHSLVLIAPSGLLRDSQIHWTSRLMYGDLLPKPLVTWLVRRRLRGGTFSSPSKSANPEATPGNAVAAEVPGDSRPAHHPDSQAPLFPNRPSVSVADAVAWQVKHHQGFIPAFVSSIKHAPIREEHERWRTVGRRLQRQRTNPQSSERAVEGLHRGKVLMILGMSDNVIVANETSQDAKGVLGEGVEIKTLFGGHDLPIVESEAVAGTIFDFWKTEE